MITVRALYTLTIAGLYCGTLCGATLPVRVSGANPRVLVDQDNVPFLIVGDSPHSLFSNLSTADAAVYLADRAARGINSLWVNLLCVRPVEGRSDGSLLDGTKPFTNTIAGTHPFTTPGKNSAGELDWVLVLEREPRK
jgi:hypothetical protein